jgi:hypothetical protein
MYTITSEYRYLPEQDVEASMDAAWTTMFHSLVLVHIYA